MNNIDQQYKNLIEGKNIIFVGPATTLLNQNLGNWIDSFDIVVRTNGSYIIPEEYQQDYGKNTNVLYTNGAFARRNKLPIKKIIKQANLKFLCMKVAAKMEKYKQVAPNRIRKMSILNTLGGFKRKGLFTGLMAINEIIQLNPNQLFITGIDFYQHSYNYYSDSYGTDLYTGLPGSHAHGLNRNFQYLKYLYQNYSNIKVDNLFLQDFLLNNKYIKTDPSQEVRTLKNKKK